jgi:hypothetical protein
MEDQAECMLVPIGATPGGRKELVDFQTSVRECCSAKTARRMVFKLIMAAAKSGIEGQDQLPKLLAGAKFQNGIDVIEMKQSAA